MEAAPRLPMVSLEPKESPSIPNFGTVFRQYLVYHYDESGSAYDRELAELDIRRNVAVKAQKDSTGLEALKRYFFELKMLYPRFPMNEGEPASVEFTWRDNFTSKDIKSRDPKFEESNILYNIGALHSVLGTVDPRKDSDSMKMSCQHFQCAAGTFERIRNDYPQMPSFDQSYDVLTFYITLMLAQAHECILEKSLLDNRKNIIIAKVSAQVVDYYKELLRALDNEATLRMPGMEGFKDFIPRQLLELKVAFYQAMAYYHLGGQSDEGKKYGETIGYLQAAVRELDSCRKIVKHTGDDECAVAEQFVRDIVQQRLTAATKDNNFIYHEKVPDINTLPVVKGTPIGKAIRFNEFDYLQAKDGMETKCIFERLLPMAAYERSSLFSAKKDKLLRETISSVEMKNAVLESKISALRLEQLNIPTGFDTIPQSLMNIMAAVRAEGDIHKRIERETEALNDVKEELQRLIEQANSTLDMLGTIQLEKNQTTELESLSKEIRRYSSEFVEALKTTDSLFRLIVETKVDLLALTGSVASIRNNLPSLDYLIKNEKVSVDLGQLSHVLEGFEKMKIQRQALLGDLKSGLEADDITKKILLPKDGELDSFLEMEIKKHDQVLGYLKQNMDAQEGLESALTAVVDRLGDFRAGLISVTAQRDEKLQQYYDAFQSYAHFNTKIAEGMDFYRDLKDNLTAAKLKLDQLFKQTLLGLPKPKAVPPPLPPKDDRSGNPANTVQDMGPANSGSVPFRDGSASFDSTISGAPKTGRPTLKAYLDAKRNALQDPTLPDMLSQMHVQPDVHRTPTFPPAAQPQFSEWTPTPQATFRSPAPYYGTAEATPYSNSVQYSQQISRHNQPLPSDANVPTPIPPTFLQAAVPPFNTPSTAQPFGRFQGWAPAPGSNYGPGSLNHGPTYSTGHPNPAFYPSQPQYSQPNLPMSNPASQPPSSFSQPPTHIAMNPAPFSGSSVGSNSYYAGGQATTLPRGYNQPSAQNAPSRHTNPQIPNQVNQRTPVPSSQAPPGQPMDYHAWLAARESSGSQANQPRHPIYQHSQQNWPSTGWTQNPASTNVQANYHAPSGNNVGLGLGNQSQWSQYVQQNGPQTQPTPSWNPNAGQFSQQSQMAYNKSIVPTLPVAEQVRHPHPTPQYQNPTSVIAAAIGPGGYTYYPNQQPRAFNVSAAPTGQVIQPNQTAPQQLPAAAPTPAAVLTPPSRASVVSTAFDDPPESVPSTPVMSPRQAANSSLLRSTDDMLSTSPGVEEDESILRPHVLSIEEIKRLKNQLNDEPPKDIFDDPVMLSKFEQQFCEFQDLCSTILSSEDEKRRIWKELQDQQSRDAARHVVGVARCFPRQNRDDRVMPYDSSRVVLQTAKDDYINASFIENIHGFFPRMIATQTPLPNTCSDFWCMIVEQGVEVIGDIMTDYEAKEFCYWPTARHLPITFGRITVSLQKESVEEAHWSVRLLHVSHAKTKVTKSVVHLLFHGWPSTGVPSTPYAFSSFVKEITQYQRKQRVLTKPSVIHCNFGTGPSGVFCSALGFVASVDAGAGIPNLQEMISKIRSCRKFMVDSPNELIFLYQVCLTYGRRILYEHGALPRYTETDSESTPMHPNGTASFAKSTKSGLAVPDVLSDIREELQRRQPTQSPTQPESPESIRHFKPSMTEPSPVHSTGETPGFLTNLPPVFSRISAQTFSLDPAESKIGAKKNRISKESFENTPAPVTEAKKSFVALSDDPLGSIDPFWKVNNK